VKTYPGIDYDFRPASYLPRNLLEAHLAQVQGTERREMIRTYAAEVRLEELDSALKQVALRDDERRRLGAIHPAFMGGEYLPGCRPGEREIVRIDLASVTADAISIRVRRCGRRYHYAIVDEYGHNEYRLAQQTSTRPFSLRELVEFLDGSEDAELGPLPLAFNQSNAEAGSSREEYLDFTRIHSALYPQLEEHYEHVFEEWVEEERREIARLNAEENEEEEEDEGLAAGSAPVFARGSIKAVLDGLCAGGTLVMTAPKPARPEEEEG
jgi:hypothetical protein